MALIEFNYTIGGDAVTADESLKFNIYNFTVFLARVGPANGSSVIVSGGVATIKLTVSDSQTYSFTIAEEDQAGNIGPVSNIKAITTA